ncbi:MAG: hypothetical protein ACM3OO_01165 [Planctomycetaceae bacterium]
MTVWVVRCAVCGKAFDVEQDTVPATGTAAAFTVPHHEVIDRSTEQAMPGVPCPGREREGIVDITGGTTSRLIR